VKGRRLKGETALPSFPSLTVSHLHLCLILASLHPAGSTCLVSMLTCLSLWCRLSLNFVYLDPSSVLPFDLAVCSQIPNRVSRSCLKVRVLLLQCERQRWKERQKGGNNCLAGVSWHCSKYSKRLHKVAFSKVELKWQKYIYVASEMLQYV